MLGKSEREFRLSLSAGLVIILVPILLLVGCSKDEPQVERPIKRVVPQKRPTKRPSTLVRRCEHIAVPAYGSKSKSKELFEEIVLPPRVDDTSVDASQRRLDAVRVLDDLQSRLRKDGRNPVLHYLIGTVQLYSLQNIKSATAHLCRAVIEAPARREYRLRLLSAWMQPGLESDLELSLSGRQRGFPWRSLLKRTRELKGVDGETKAAVFEDGLNAMVVAKGYRKLSRSKGKELIYDLDTVMSQWASGSKNLWITVVYSSRNFKKTSHLMDRSRAEVSPRIWPVVGSRRGQSLLYARGTHAISDVVSFITDSLKGVNVIIGMSSGSKRLYIEGKMDAAGKFTVRFYSSSPYGVLTGRGLEPAK